MTYFLKRIACWGVLVAGVVWGLSPARAATSNQEATTSLIQELETATESRKLGAQFIERAKLALSRARSAREAGNHHQATLLEALALELLETARDLVRTAQTESKVAELSRRATFAETRAVRAQALIEQTAARRGRAAAQLEALQQERESPSAESSKPAVPPATPAGSPVKQDLAP